MPARTERLARCYTGAVHDVRRMMGHDSIVLPPEIQAVAPGTRLAGPVWTVSGHIDHTRTEEVVNTESAMRRAQVGGMDPVAAYNEYGKF